MIQGGGALFNSNDNSAKKLNCEPRNLRVATRLFKPATKSRRGSLKDYSPKIHEIAGQTAKTKSTLHLDKYAKNEKLESEEKPPMSPMRKRARTATLRLEAIKNDAAINDYQVNINDIKINSLNSSSYSKSYFRNFKKKKSNKMGENSTYIFQQKCKNTGSSFEQTKQQEFLYYKYNLNCILMCLVSIISVITVLLQDDISHNNSSALLEYIALWVSLTASVTLWFLIATDYIISCELLYLIKGISKSFWRSDRMNILSLIFTYLIFLPHPNPVFRGITVGIYNSKYQITPTYSLNSIFGIFCMLRCWYIVKYYLVGSEFHSPRIQRVCEMNGFDTNIGFSMKASMAKVPYTAVAVYALICLLVCSFSLRIFERELDAYTGFEFATYWNTIWCLFITMTTVGYGDYYPSTIFGRITAIVAAISGVFLISMLVIAITNILVFEAGETDVYLMLERIALTEEKDVLAAKLVVKYVRLVKMMKNRTIDQNTKDKLRDQVIYTLLQFREKCAEINSTFPPYSNYDSILSNLHEYNNNLEDLSIRYSDLKRSVDELS